MKRFTTLLAGTIGALALLAVDAHAVPNTVSFTGRITQGGSPVADGTVNLSFELWTAATGGSSTGWTETHNSTPIANSLVHVQLGSTNGLTGSDFAGSELYLEITVNGDVQSPRIPISSTPYSIRSATSDTLGSLTPSDVALSNHNHDGTYAPASHSHTEYAATSHTHNYAATNHTHTEYAATSHTHNYAAVSHSHAATDITSGTLSTNRYSAYSDLSAEGYLNNSGNSDLLTKSQLDSRYSLTSHTHAGGASGAAGSQLTSFTAIALDSVSHKTMRTVAVPAHSGGTSLVGHVYIEKNAAGESRYEVQIRRGSCTGTLLGSAYFRKEATTNTYVGFTVTVTAYDSSTAANTYYLCARRSVGTSTSNAYLRGLVASW